MSSDFSAPPHDQSAVVSQRLLAREYERVLDALREDRFNLFYQPIVRADAGSFIAFHEALARIHMPDGSVIPAGQFMPFVDNTEIGTEVDLKTVALAMETLDAHPELRLSINLSTRSMRNPDWIKQLEIHDKTVRERLIVEITESGAMSNVDATTQFLDKVRHFGSALAIDDFGTGSTSFRYFRDFKFDAIKIDGMFIRDIAHNMDYRVVVEALVKICNQFEMFTVAEFIETEEDANVALQIGVDCFQGYLIGKPTAEPAHIDQSWSAAQRMAG